MNGDPITRLHVQAHEALALVYALEDPEAALEALRSLVALTVELRLCAERDLGALLELADERSGRASSTCRSALRRRLRARLGLTRDAAMYLRRFGAIDPAEFDQLLEQAWAQPLAAPVVGLAVMRARFNPPGR